LARYENVVAIPIFDKDALPGEHGNAYVGVQQDLNCLVQSRKVLGFGAQNLAHLSGQHPLT
jgi:hypothetical protein